MGYKDICLSCRTAFNRGTDFETPLKIKCSNCGELTIQVNHKFKPPKKNEIKKWEVVSYLIKNGFDYTQVYYDSGPKKYQQYGKFPENMRDAIAFVKFFNS